MKSQESRTIQVFIVASSMLAWGYERLMHTAQPAFAVASSACTFGEALRNPALAGADAVLFDPDGQEGLGALTGLPALTQAKLILLTSARDLETLDTAVLAGARGIVHKSDSPSVLLKAIERVCAGELWMDRMATARVLLELARRTETTATDPERCKIASLTARERSTIQAITADCAPGKVIASRMCISEHTLRNHLSSIYDKLGVQNRVALYAYATKHGLQRSAD